MKALRLLCAALIFSGSALAAPPNVDVPPLKFKPAAPERLTLKNGVIVYLMEDHELPLFHFNMRLHCSPIDEPVPLALDYFGAQWRTGGTKKRTPDQLNEELEMMAARIETSAMEDTASISLTCLSKDTSHALEIYQDVLMNPAFDEDQLTLSKQKTLEALRRKNETPGQVGRRAFRDALFGPTHIYARDPTPASLAKMKRSHLLEVHQRVAVPDRAIISVAGDFRRDELVAELEKLFANWKPSGRPLPSYDYSVKAPLKGGLFLVAKDFSQSRITIGRLGITRHSPDSYAVALAHYILGGGGPSRLFAEIRSRRGLAYVVGSFYTEPGGPGMAGVICQTKAESTVGAIRAIQGELDKFTVAPPRPDEVSLAKDATIHAFVFNFDSPDQIVNEEANEEFYGYPSDYNENYNARIKAVSAGEIQKVGRKYFAKDGMKIMVVGDPAKFDAELKTLGEVTVLPLESID